MVGRFSVIQGGVSVGFGAKPGRVRLEAVALRVVPLGSAPTSPRASIPAQAFVGIRPKDGAPEAA